MNVAMLWKEYRQQRSIWAAEIILALLLIMVFAMTLGQSAGWQMFADDRVKPVLAMMVIILALAYGVICGAMLLSSEKEEETLPFLDRLTARRSTIWIAKAQAGFLFVFAQSLALGLLGPIFGFAAWSEALIVPILALDGFACGLLGGALCRRVLPAVLAGIALLIVSWNVSVLLGSGSTVVGLLLKSGLSILAVALSWRRFCEPDFARSHRRETARPGPIASCNWLVFRHGRWVMLAVLLGAAGLGPVINLKPIIDFPLAAFAIGLACGLAVFAPEQSARNETFIGAQRFPLGRIWLTRTFGWAFVSQSATLALWYTGLFTFIIRESQHGVSFGNLESNWASLIDPLGMMNHSTIFLCVAQGFGLGQFFGALCRRPVIAAFLAGSLGLMLCALWLPSVLLGDLSLWQYLGLPVILVIATRTTMRAWVSGRLYQPRSLATIGGFSLAAIGWLASAIWYRVVEFPEVGEPFDVREYVAGLPSRERNEAGNLLHEAATEYRSQLAKVAKQVPPPTRPIFEEERHNFERNRPSQYEYFIGDVFEHGWPEDDAEFASWLDAMLSGDWLRKTQRVARSPLGVMYDPRLLRYNTRTPDVETTRQIAAVIGAHAIQLIAQKKFAESLEQVETLLGLSRQVMNRSPRMIYFAGAAHESAAIQVLERWLQAVGPKTELLKKAQGILEYHQANRPDPLDICKSEYLMYMNDTPASWIDANKDNELERDIVELAVLVPWERERQKRLIDILFQEEMRIQRMPLWQRLDLKDPRDSMEKLRSTRWWSRLFLSISLGRRYSPVQARGGLLITALARYQADHGKAADKLDDLVPGYLAELPIDPFTGKAFHYRVWAGKKKDEPPMKVILGTAAELFRPKPHWKEERLRIGQRYLWSDGDQALRPESSKDRERGYLFMVPDWPK